MSFNLILSQPCHHLPTQKGKFSKKNIPDVSAFKKPSDIANGFTTFTTAVMWGSYVVYRYLCTPAYGQFELN